MQKNPTEQTYAFGNSHGYAGNNAIQAAVVWACLGWGTLLMVLRGNPTAQLLGVTLKAYLFGGVFQATPSVAAAAAAVASAVASAARRSCARPPIGGCCLKWPPFLEFQERPKGRQACLRTTTLPTPFWVQNQSARSRQKVWLRLLWSLTAFSREGSNPVRHPGLRTPFGFRSSQAPRPAGPFGGPESHTESSAGQSLVLRTLAPCWG